MKKVFLILALIFGFITVSVEPAYSQGFYKNQSSNLKDRKSLNKDRDSFNKSRVSKDNQKLAKKMEKEGWKVNGGNPSLGYQLQVRDDFEVYRDDDNNRIYITGPGQGTASTRIKATKQAELTAQQALAAQIQTQIATLTKGALIEDMEIDEVSKSFVEGVLKRSEIIYNAYIHNPDGTYTVEQVWAVDARKLDQEVEELAKKEKKAELEGMRNELDEKVSF